MFPPSTTAPSRTPHLYRLSPPFLPSFVPPFLPPSNFALSIPIVCQCCPLRRWHFLIGNGCARARARGLRIGLDWILHDVTQLVVVFVDRRRNAKNVATLHENGKWRFFFFAPLFLSFSGPAPRRLPKSPPRRRCIASAW